MNTPHKITFSQAVDGYELAAQARHLSPHTLLDYRNTFAKFYRFLGADLPIADITQNIVEEFLAVQTVSKKTILNYHTGLAALWTWALKERLVPDHLLHQVDPPTPEQRAIVPFTQSDVKAILAALGQTREYTRPGKVASQHSLPNADRNRAIILLLLDTGMRASELCTLELRGLDLRNHTAKVFGKGSKERILPFSARTGQAVWRYCSQSRADATAQKPVFVTLQGQPLERCRLLKTLTTIGQRAGIPDCHPHRFRHTFAINFLRNGGDSFTLQKILGHTTLDMVRTYLQLAQADLETAHRRASPVDNWRL